MNCFDKLNQRFSLRLKRFFFDNVNSLNCDEINSLKDIKICPSPLREGQINWINNSEKVKCYC